MARPDLVLVRHGETDWSRSRRHTGRTDISLTDHGREQARAAAPLVRGLHVDHVRVSPLLRARETCDLLGLGLDAVVDENLLEWDYGDYEGITTKEIRETVPEWTVWTGSCPAGETIDHVASRVDQVIAAVRATEGRSLAVAHGHVLRVLAARWLDLDPRLGSRFRLDTATVSLLGWERETPVVMAWNVRDPHA